MITCPDCSSTISSPPCGCGWKPSEAPQTVRSTYVQQPFGLTKEEFGVDLFDAIKAAIGSKQAFATADLYRKKKMTAKANEYQQRGKTLLVELERLFKNGTINEVDQHRIMATL